MAEMRKGVRRERTAWRASSVRRRNDMTMPTITMRVRRSSVSAARGERGEGQGSTLREGEGRVAH